MLVGYIIIIKYMWIFFQIFLKFVKVFLNFKLRDRWSSGPKNSTPLLLWCFANDIINIILQIIKSLYA